MAFSSGPEPAFNTRSVHTYPVGGAGTINGVLTGSYLTPSPPTHQYETLLEPSLLAYAAAGSSATAMTVAAR